MNCNGNCRECTSSPRKERLYRGKRIDNGEWFIGCDIWAPWFYDQNFITLSDHKDIVRVDPQTVGEFTGALDADGTRIFEGDIVDTPRWVVSYSTGMKCFSGMQVGWYIQRDNWESWSELIDTDKVTVIGNIHDNPELMRR
jgi:uncharacterized phage protein (TIGR01671 family)